MRGQEMLDHTADTGERSCYWRTVPQIAYPSHPGGKKACSLWWFHI